MEYLKNELIKIKKDGRSFLGIDGGNINAKTWFCGIEFGGELQAMEKYYNNTVKTDDSIDNFDLPIPYRIDAGGFERSTYDRYLSTMYINLFEEDILINGSDTKRIVEILKHRLYNKNSNIFKLNLYPLAKKDTSWDKNIKNDLGIEKEEYYHDLFNKRKFFIKELLNKFHPKTIICTSTNEYREDFVEAFLNKDENINYKWIIRRNKNKEFKISIYQTNTTKLIIIPFLGRGNLSSYDDVISISNYLRSNLIN